ncbi:MAG: DUF2254 domain-containing protein [Pyrinomonadaceae bacterium]
MRIIRQFLIYLKSSLWFVPGLMILASIILALLLVFADSNLNNELLARYPRIFGFGAEGSRGMLTAIAGSMLTVAALAFAMTLSTISQASAMYSPRVLRNFMRDRINQFILGYFVSVFAYCLIVLVTIRGADEIKFVPSLSVIFALFLAVGGIIVLIYFIHHIAESLEVTNIVKAIEKETVFVIDKIFPEKMSAEDDDREIDPSIHRPEEADWHSIKSNSDGYIQYTDIDGLADLAHQRDLLFRIEYGVGQFVAEGTKLVSVNKDPEEDLTNEVNNRFNIFRYRTIEQDAGYGVRQIVDIALKALSPGVNDTTTAIICIDYLAVIVSKIAQRTMPSSVRIKDGELRVLAKSPDFQRFVETAFDQIRISGKSNLAVFIRLLKALSIVAEKAGSKKRIDVVKEQIILTRDFGNETLQTDYEKEVLEKLVTREIKNIGIERV